MGALLKDPVQAADEQLADVPVEDQREDSEGADHRENSEGADHRALRFLTAGSVDDGKSTLIGRLLFDIEGLA